MSRTTLPSAEEFAGYAREARFVPVYRQLTSDTLTPVSAYQRVAAGTGPFYLKAWSVANELVATASSVLGHLCL